MKSKFVVVLFSFLVISLTSCGSFNEEYGKQKEAESQITEIEDKQTETSDFQFSETKAEILEDVQSTESLIDESKDNEEIPVEYDVLQQLYLSIGSDTNYAEMIELVQSTGLPFSEEKNNGSRTVQVAFADDATAQKHMDEGGDYLEIIYVYPKNENSSNDVLEKYTFGTCVYHPDNCSLSLISHVSGSYFSYYEPGNYISNLGTALDLDNSMSKEQQLDYYFENK